MQRISGKKEKSYLKRLMEEEDNIEGQRSEIRDQKSKVESQRSAVRGVCCTTMNCHKNEKNNSYSMGSGTS